MLIPSNALSQFRSSHHMQVKFTANITLREKQSSYLKLSLPFTRRSTCYSTVGNDLAITRAKESLDRQDPPVCIHESRDQASLLLKSYHEDSRLI